MKETVTLHNGSITFQNGNKLDIVLEPTELEVQAGSIVVLRGGNGSGKSSFLRAASGVYQHYFDHEGPRCEGLAVWRKSGRTAEIVPRSTPFDDGSGFRAGFLSQSPRSTVFCSTVEDEVAFTLEHSGFDGADVRDRLSTSLEELSNLGIDRAARPHGLSKGQQQLVGFTALLQGDPDVLFLDEPSAALDDRAIQWMIDKILSVVAMGRVKFVFIACQDDRLIESLPPNDQINTVTVCGNLESGGGSAAVELSLDFLSAADTFRKTGLLLTDVECVRDDFRVSLPETELNPGNTLLISGGNGTGKSTILEAVAGFRRAKKGTFTYGQTKHKAGRRSCSRNVAYNFQNAEEQIMFNSCLQELAYPRKLSAWAQVCNELLNNCGFNLRTSPWHLSFGQRKLLAHYSLAFTSPIWVVDEPLASLDRHHRDEFISVANQFVDGGGILILSASHDQPELARLTNTQHLRLA